MWLKHILDSYAPLIEPIRAESQATSPIRTSENGHVKTIVRALDTDTIDIRKTLSCKPEKGHREDMMLQWDRENVSVSS
jgi:hypothetical protein